MYSPPFEITNKILNLVAQITERVGALTATLQQPFPTPMLRKENRIKTIQSSLAIENNTLTIAQVTAIVEGKHVLGAPNEIQEVKNAIDAYNLMLQLDPYNQKDLLKAHKAMMANLIGQAGYFRGGNVGVFDATHCIHLAPPATRVNELMNDLFEWMKQTDVHPLVSSSVFHYEFEFIHPFADGNGRMGRMWQTLLLAQWNPLFYWVPVETIVKEHQQEYYDAINQCDNKGDSTLFIEFMLQCLSESLQDLGTEKSTEKSTEKLIRIIRENPDITIAEMCKLVGLSDKGVRKNLDKLKQQGILQRIGPAKGGHWKVNEP